MPRARPLLGVTNQIIIEERLCLQANRIVQPRPRGLPVIQDQSAQLNW
jgi:hypothetical protein